MKWLSNFISDFGGSLVGREFYAKVLSYKAGRAWSFYVTLIALMSVINVLFYSRYLDKRYNKLVALFQSGGYEVIFENGIMKNAPASPKFVAFDSDSFVVWKGVESGAVADSIRQSHPGVSQFFGPRKAFIYTDGSYQSQSYPSKLTLTVNTETLLEWKRSYAWVVLMAMFLVMALLLLVWSALLIAMVIVPLLALKYSRRGLRLGEMWKLGMFLINYHMVFATTFLLLNIFIPYSVLYNLPLYIMVTLFMVKLESVGARPPDRFAGGPARS